MKHFVQQQQFFKELLFFILPKNKQVSLKIFPRGTGSISSNYDAGSPTSSSVI